MPASAVGVVVVVIKGIVVTVVTFFTVVVVATVGIVVTVVAVDTVVGVDVKDTSVDTIVAEELGQLKAKLPEQALAIEVAGAVVAVLVAVGVRG